MKSNVVLYYLDYIITLSARGATIFYGFRQTASLVDEHFGMIF